VRPGRHAAADGSFERSAGTAAARGAFLLVVAVVLGIVLLQAADKGTSSRGLTTGTHASAPTTTVPTPTTLPTRAPADVKVLAVNGTTTAGVGSRVSDKLRTAGYNVLAPTDARRKPVASSSVYFTVGYQSEATVIADLLGLQSTAVQPMPATPPVADTRAANVLVLAGQDLARALPAPATTTTVRRAATGSTTTTARKSTSTTVHTATTAHTTTTTR